MLSVALVFVLITAGVYANAQTIAFPGVEGFCQYIKGGVSDEEKIKKRCNMSNK